MLVAAGGGGAGGTPWGMLTVQQMQTLIQNPDTERHYELLTGWKQSADLLVEHRWQVQNYRDNLASVWPPEKNAASAAYIARLDDLIANLSETYEAAISNHDAFAAATLSISLAQKEMNNLAREYESNEQLLLTQAPQQQSPSGQPQPSPSPSGEQPPVAPGRQEALHQKAVTLLNGVSADLALAQVNVRTPTLYKPIFKDSTKDPNGGDVYNAPPIPPVTPSFASDNSAGPVTNRPSATFPAGGSSVLPPPAAAPTQPGLILGGANPALPPSPASLAPTPPNPIAGPGPVTSPGLLPPSASSFAPNTGNTPVRPVTTGSGRVPGMPREGLPHSTSPMGARGLPPGGVIGGVPGMGMSQPVVSRPQTQRINPIGGVIGEGPLSRNGARGVPVGDHLLGSGQYGPPGGRRPSRSGSESRWNPDNPWETEEGVDPVVLPPREKRIDPGPAIGLP